MNAILAPLASRDFALLWLASLVSRAGDWLLNVALPFYIYERTGSALASGAALVAQIAPGLLFAVPAGVIVDRWDRRRILIVAQTLRGAIVLCLLAARSAEWLWLVYLVGLVHGAVGHLEILAQNALVPSLASRHPLGPQATTSRRSFATAAGALAGANALMAFGGALIRIVAAPAGGALLAALGLGAVVVLDGASFFAAAALVSLIRSSDVGSPAPIAPPLEFTAPSRRVREIRGALRLVLSDATLVTTLAVVALCVLAQSGLQVLAIPFVRDILHIDSAGFGLLVGVQGAGGLAGVLLAPHLVRALGAPRSIAACALLAGTLVALVVTAPTWWGTVLLSALLGVPALALGVAATTLFHQFVPPAYHGRVFGIYGAVNTLAVIAGSGLAGVGADRAGVEPSLFATAGLYVCAGLLGLLPRGSSVRRPVHTPAPENAALAGGISGAPLP